MRAVATTQVDRPAREVWEVLSDHEGMVTWMRGLRVSLDQEGEGDRNGVGAVRRIEQPGPAPAIVEEITAYAPGSTLGYRALSGVPFRDYSGEVRLVGQGSGTRIEWELNATQRFPGERVLLGGVARLLLRALTEAVHRATYSGRIDS